MEKGKADFAEVKLAQRDADFLGRQFNSALVNSTAYGVDHAVTERTFDTFVNSLLTYLQSHDSLTLLFDRGTLFFEDFSLEGKFNATRIERAFRARGIQSLTFLPEISTADVQILMRMLNDDEYQGQLERMRSELETQGIASLRINHVMMKKFTATDEVIDREGLAELTELAERGVSSGAAGATMPGQQLSGDLMERVRNIFSMKALLEDPDRVGREVVTQTEEDSAQAAELLRSLRGEIGRYGELTNRDNGEVSLTQVMEAVNRVRGELADSMAGQKEVARFLAENGSEVIDEVDQMTFDTVALILRDEYRGGNNSVKRLAQILRRILPETRDIKRSLPSLKKVLIAEGMALSDWIAFVHELSAELKSDDLARLLEQGSEDVGVTVEELLRDIRQDPEEAARLLVLAAELRRTGSAGDRRLSKVLVEHIQSLGSETGEEGAVGEGLRQALRQAGEKLKASRIDRGQQPAQAAPGGDSSPPEDVDDEVDAPVDDWFDRIRIGTLVEKMRKSGSLDEQSLSASLSDMFESDSDLERLGSTLVTRLKEFGFTRESLDRVFEQTQQRLKCRSRLELLPDGMLEPNVINYLIEREVAACRRFGSYFSCLLLMIARIRPFNEDDGNGNGDGEWRAVQPAEIEQLLPQLFRQLPPHVRDIDLLGSLGNRDRNIPMVLLTMADAPGAQIALERMLNALARLRFELDGESIEVDTIGVSEQFDFERHQDRKSYLKMLQSKLAGELIKRLRGAS